MVEDLDPKELVAFQKKQLKQRLGMGGGEDFMDMGDMIKDEDFIVSAEQAKQRKKYAFLSCTPSLSLSSFSL